MPTIRNESRAETVQARSVALTPALNAQLQELAELEDRSASSIVRVALRQHFAERDEAGD